MPVIPFGDYRPDITDYNGQATRLAQNVFPRGDGYGPVPSLVAYTLALPGVCRGFFYARKNDGSIQIFAGTAQRLYTWTTAAGGSWIDVSNGGTAYATIAFDGQWQFRQFNNWVLAVNGNVLPQKFDLTATGNTFVNIGKTVGTFFGPPSAKYIAIVNRFVVLSGITTAGAVYRVQWSDLNDVDEWRGPGFGTNGLSDLQDLADGGMCRGVVGGEAGIIMQDTAIRRMTFSPGSPYTFGIDRISVDDGLLAPYSLISSGDRIFFLSPQGFKMLVPGGYPTPVAKERFDRSFLADMDQTQLQMVIGATDPRRTRVYWAYKSVNGVAGQFDRIAVYDWALNNGSIINQRGEYIATLSQPAVGLDDGPPFPYSIPPTDSVDNQNIASWDNISVATYSQLGGAFTDHTLGFFAGANLEATIDTAEQSGDGRRFRIRGMRPVTDAPAAFCSTMVRDTLQATATQSAESGLNIAGKCPQNVSTRYARGRLRVPAGTVWSFATGIEPDLIAEGTQ